VQIQNEAMHAGGVEQRLRVAYPIGGDGDRVWIGFVELIVAGEAANRFSGEVEDFELDRSGRLFV
jgi:hypothetical protein